MNENGQQEEDFEVEEQSSNQVQQPDPTQRGAIPEQLVSIKMPVGQIANLQRPPYRPQSQQVIPPRKATEISAKEFLEDLILNPDSINYMLAIHRYAPAEDDSGEEVRRGHLMNVPVMPLDALNTEITKAWGGGQYRAVVVDGSGAPVIGEKFKSAILINISTAQVKPKNNRNEKTATAITTTPASSGFLERIEKIRQEEQLEEIEAKADERRNAREIRRRQQERELRILNGGGDGESSAKTQDAFLNALKDMRADFTNAIRDLNAKIETIATKTAADGQQNMFALMMESQNKTLAAIVPALAPKREDGEGMKMLETVMKMSQKENSLQTQLVNNLMQIAMKPPESNSMKDQIELFTKLMTLGETKFTRALEMVREQGGDEEAAIAALSGATAGQKMEAGWMGLIQGLLANPSIGAALAPVLGGIAQKFLGTAEPQSQHFDRAAQNLRPVGPNVPPMLPMQPQFAQQPQQFRTPALPNNQYPVQQQQFSTPPAQTSFTAPQQAAQTAPLPGGTNPAPSVAAPVIPPMPQEAPVIAGHQNVPVEQQTQLDGEQQPDDAGELDGVEDGADPSASEDPAERLKYYVNESMKIALSDIQDKRMTRDWPQDAYNYWSRDFLVKLSETTRDMGVQMIGDNTDPAVWDQLVKTLQADQNEMDRFFKEYEALIAAIKNATGQAAPPVPTAPSQPLQAPPPSQPIQPASAATPIAPPAVTPDTLANQAVSADLGTI